MKRTLIAAMAILMLLAGAFCTFGDIARPKPSPIGLLYTSLVITSDPKASEARLVISEDTLKSLQGAATRKGVNLSLSQDLTHSSNRTIMAGVFMFLAISFAGIWFARSGQRRNPKALAAVLLLAAMFGVGTMMVRANAGPPGYVRWGNLPQALKDGKETQGSVNIDLVPGDDDLKLIIPLRKSNGPGEE